MSDKNETIASDDELITTKEAAKILGVSRSRVSQFIGEKRLTIVKKFNNCNMLRRGDVIEFGEKPRRQGVSLQKD